MKNINPVYDEIFSMLNKLIDDAKGREEYCWERQMNNYLYWKGKKEGYEEIRMELIRKFHQLNP